MSRSGAAGGVLICSSFPAASLREMCLILLISRSAAAGGVLIFSSFPAAPLRRFAAALRRCGKCL